MHVCVCVCVCVWVCGVCVCVVCVCVCMDRACVHVGVWDYVCVMYYQYPIATSSIVYTV